MRDKKKNCGNKNLPFLTFKNQRLYKRCQQINEMKSFLDLQCDCFSQGTPKHVLKSSQCECKQSSIDIQLLFNLLTVKVLNFYVFYFFKTRQSQQISSRGTA